MNPRKALFQRVSVVVRTAFLSHADSRRLVPCATLLLFGCSSTLLLQPAAFGQQQTQPAVSVDLERLQSGLDSITESKVKETVSFLASDELAGRATLSPGFEKAAEFVAKRFKDAGLKPVAGDSFFNETELPVTRTPTEGISLKSNGKPVSSHVLLAGGSEKVAGDFGVTEIQLTDELDSKIEGIAVVEAPQNAGGRRWIAQLVRLSNKVRQAGGVAMFIKAETGCPLWDDAKQAQNQQLEDERMRFMIPVVLLPSETVLDSTCTVELPQQIRQSGKAKNVIGVLPGSDPKMSSEFVLFSAHLDHLPPRDSGEDRIFNGADDNATGVTAVICLAEAFSKLKVAPKRSVVFMTFWGEERGLLGSKAFAENPTIELSKIVSNINIEMIGRPEAGAQGKVWVTGWEKSDLGPLMALGADSVGVTIFDHPKFSSMLYGSSDNYSFAAKGVIAHSFSAGSLHKDYHQTSDEVEKLETDHMTTVIKGLMAGAFPIADGEMTPVAAEQ